MKVFLTGASGRIGSHIIPHLVSRGHTVTGLVRTQAKADQITKLASTGVTPLIGSLTDTDLLTDNAKSHDAVIHCAMDHGSGDMASAAAQERATIELFGKALEGTGKPLIMSSGTGFLPKGGDETTRGSGMARAETETHLLTEIKDKGVRSIAVRLAMNTHSPELMHPFFGMLIGASKKLGFIPYTESGVWNGCNADDAALLYVLALESAEPGTAVHSFAETYSTKDLAEVLAKKTGLKAGLATPDQIKELGWLAMLLNFRSNLVTNDWTKKTFGWDPKGESTFAEFDNAPKSYFGNDADMFPDTTHE